MFNKIGCFMFSFLKWIYFRSKKCHVLWNQERLPKKY